MGIDFPLSVFTGDEVFPFFIQYGEHDEPLYTHRHRDFCELVLVFKGSAVHEVNGQRHPLACGDVFVISGDTEHGYRETDGLRIANIMFKPRILEPALDDLGRLEGFQSLFRLEPWLSGAQHFESRLHLAVDEQERAAGLVRLMVDEYNGGVRAGRPGSRSLVLSWFTTLVVLLSRWYGSAETPPAESPLKLARAVAFLESHYSESLDLETIAREACLSPRHFRRLFNESYGTSPMQYLQRVRLRAACALLEHSERSITDLALACGFSDGNLFSRQFSRSMGLSPSEWRRLHRSRMGE